MLHVELHTVCKIAHCVSNCTLCVKLHRSTWGPFVGTFRVNCQKIPLTWKNFPQALLAALVTNMRYVYMPYKHRQSSCLTNTSNHCFLYFVCVCMRLLFSQFDMYMRLREAPWNEWKCLNYSNTCLNFWFPNILFSCQWISVSKYPPQWISTVTNCILLLPSHWCASEDVARNPFLFFKAILDSTP